MGAQSAAVIPETISGVMACMSSDTVLRSSSGIGFVPPPLPLAAKLPEGFDAFTHNVQGWLLRHRDHATKLRGHSVKVLEASALLEKLNDTSLADLLRRLSEAVRRDPINACGQLDDALAAIGEASRRALGVRPYGVQFMGALAMHYGWLAEMATGEGKTLTASLAAVLAAWSGRPCHVVTSNDYLAARDAKEMAPLYKACSVTVSTVASTHKPEERLFLYGSDVVYLTAKELLADYLRDQLASRAGYQAQRLAFKHWLGVVPSDALAARVQVRGLHSVIVDEADSVLIDEAVTPLILSAPRDDFGLAEAVRRVSTLADMLSEGSDYQLLRRQRLVRLFESSRQALSELASDLAPLWQAEPRREELLHQALIARHFILPGQQYLVVEGKVILLDEFTGRMTPGRTLTAGLQQAVEAREGLELSEPNESLGQMSFQSFFRRIPRLAGITGTGREASREFWRIYSLEVIPIPSRKPLLRLVSTPKFFPTSELKWQAVVAQIIQIHQHGQPVLVGVRSVESSLHLAGLLQRRGLTFELLNAQRHLDEARIVARAGELGRITIATNMAGRGTDIRLGDSVDVLGGLHVIIAEVNESGRIDRQLAGRCGRQGDPGSVSVFVSSEDSLFKRFLSELSHALVSFCARLRLPLPALLVKGIIRLAQRRAEADSFNNRLEVLKSDDWLEKALSFESTASH